MYSAPTSSVTVSTGSFLMQCCTSPPRGAQTGSPARSAEFPLIRLKWERSHIRPIRSSHAFIQLHGIKGTISNKKYFHQWRIDRRRMSLPNVDNAMLKCKLVSFVRCDLFKLYSYKCWRLWVDECLGITFKRILCWHKQAKYWKLLQGSTSNFTLHWFLWTRTSTRVLLEKLSRVSFLLKIWPGETNNKVSRRTTWNQSIFSPMASFTYVGSYRGVCFTLRFITS